MFSPHWRGQLRERLLTQTCPRLVGSGKRPTGCVGATIRLTSNSQGWTGQARVTSPPAVMIMSRRGQLVTQYVENVSRNVLEHYQHLIRGYVRHRHGVYALYRRGKLYYVGLAGNLRSRLSQHLRDKHGESWDRFSVYLTVDNAHVKELETLTLRIMRPPGNKQQGTFARAENLRRRLRGVIRAERLAELDDLIGFERQTRGKIENGRPIVSDAAGWRPPLARYLKNRKGFTIRAHFKGHTTRARVLRDGSISLRRKRYNSPSLAAAIIARHAMNGWIFWLYERAPGDWVHLDNLRK